MTIITFFLLMGYSLAAGMVPALLCLAVVLWAHEDTPSAAHPLDKPTRRASAFSSLQADMVRYSTTWGQP